jgi:hypothetical protein
MMRFRTAAWLGLVTALILSMVVGVTPARANVTALVLHRRTCGTVDAYVTYDSFSEGNPPYFAAFAVDLNNNGVFGEAGEPIRYIRLGNTGESQLVGAHIVFTPLPEGSTIAVTAYEVDSAGGAVSPQVAPVAYQCTHRPATNPLPPNTGIDVPDVAIVARIGAVAVTVYDGPSVKANPLGGLGRGALVNVVARNERGDWLQIEYKGQLGWFMWQRQATLLGLYSTLPVLPNVEDWTPTPAPTATR